MVFVNMDSLQFYIPPAEIDLCRDERPTTFNPRILSSCWEGEYPTTLEVSNGSSEVLHNLDELRSQNGPRSLQKDSLKADKDAGSISSERVNSSWDGMIPLLCHRVNDCHYRSRFRHPPGTFRKTGVLRKPTAGETAGE